MRLPALITAATCVQALAPTKVLRCVENDKAGQDGSFQKNNLVDTTRKTHDRDVAHARKAADAQNARSKRLYAPQSYRHIVDTRRSPRRPRRRRRTATTPSRAPRSPRSTRTRRTRCARPSLNYQMSSSRPSSSASRTTSLSSSKRHRRLCPASNSARPCAV